MNMQYAGKRTVVRSSHTMYVACLMSFLYNLDFDYVSKMRYNKEKDLVFVTKPARLWGESQHVYEVHHLEQMVPSAVTAVQDLSANHRNGILTVKDMAQNENLKFYKEAKYWNADLSREFLKETNGLWENNMEDKHNGRIFQTGGVHKDFELAMDQIDREMDAAVQKHGKVELPTNLHIDDFYDTIDQKKQNIARA